MRTFVLLVALVGCRKAQETGDTGPAEVDGDGDGVLSGADCDDADPAVGAAGAWFGDADGDGHGAGEEVLACVAPAGSVAVSDDCDDGDSDVFPGAPEPDCADPTDYNCDGSTGFADEDGDGFAACEDCDDGSAADHPGAREVCDGADNNCDDATDEAGAAGETTYFRDADGDGWGDAGDDVAACVRPDGYVDNDLDCDDSALLTSPDADETCNGRDDDCDGDTDDDATDAAEWFADGDGDGSGALGASTFACAAPDGFAASSDDCDDADPDVHPGAVEADCTDPVDRNCDGSVGFADADKDGTAACKDCDDADAAQNPGAREVCNAEDDDCDGATDEAGASGEALFWADGDADGFGAGTPTKACAAPSGSVENDDDCDDAAFAVKPGAPERCNGSDDDCDGTSDELAVDMGTFYADVDGDGAGSKTSVIACAAPSGFVGTSDDCDDGRADTAPGKTELCDARDNDCDGDVPTNEADGDSDKWRVCDGDCDDADAADHPQAAEVCDNEDDDCDGIVDDGATGKNTYYKDADGDGYGTGGATVACVAPSGYTATPGDCDDGKKDAYPGAPQVCDGRDANCDTLVDNDGDKDGAANKACGGTDCNDARSDITALECSQDGKSASNAARSCSVLLAAIPSSTSGNYFVDLDGVGSGAPAASVYCDMSNGEGHPFAAWASSLAAYWPHNDTGGTIADRVGTRNMTDGGSSSVSSLNTGLGNARRHTGSTRTTFPSLMLDDDGRWTLSVWLNTTYTDGDYNDYDGNVLADNGWHGGHAKLYNNRFCYGHFTPGGSWADHRLECGTSNVSNGQWHNLVFVNEVDTIDVWVDGVRETNNAPADISGGFQFQFDGTIGMGGQTYAAATIDDLAVWTRALTDVEVAAIYAAGRAGVPIDP